MNIDKSKFFESGSNVYQNHYRMNSFLDTCLGSMAIEIRIDKELIASEHLFEIAGKYIQTVLAEQMEILTEVYSHYKIMEEEGELGDVPCGLSLSEITPYLHNQYLCVADTLEDGEGIDEFIYIRPEWEQEHCIYIRRYDGKWKLDDPY